MLRECTLCDGRDGAMLSESEQNDRTYLLSRWFHCVKLAEHSTHERHPLHALFAGRGQSHLFLCRADGGQRIDLPGNQSARRLRDAMVAILRSAYTDDVAGRLRELLDVLDEFDRVDEQMIRIDTAFQRELERNGAGTRRARMLAGQLREATAARNELLARELELLEAAPVAVPVDPVAGR